MTAEINKNPPVVSGRGQFASGNFESLLQRLPMLGDVKTFEFLLGTDA